MIDEALRRAARDGLDEPRRRWLALRAGREDLARPFVEGDVIEVHEVDSPWLRGPWEGVVLRVLPKNDAYVRPLNRPGKRFRVRPSSEYLAKGLYLTHKDVAASRLLRPAGLP